MLKAAVLLFVFGVLCVSAQTKPTPCATAAGTNCRVAMPEPTAIPELALGLAGVLAYAVWRQRKQAKRAIQ